MTRLFCLCSLLFLSFCSSPLAQASAVDTVRFVQPAKTVVWDESGDMKSGSEVLLGDASHIVPADYVMTGTLLPVAASASLERHEKTIRLASNAAVTLFATSDSAMRDVDVRIISTGPNATVSGGAPAQAALIPARTKTPIFKLNEKTAARPGTISSQTVTLNLSWTGEATPQFLIAAHTR